MNQVLFLRKVLWSQLLKDEYFLVSLLLCDSKLNECGYWTKETFKEVILGNTGPDCSPSFDIHGPNN